MIIIGIFVVLVALIIAYSIKGAQPSELPSEPSSTTEPASPSKTPIVNEPKKPAPPPTFKLVYNVQFEADYPGDYCCHFYDHDRIEGNIYQACISEEAIEPKKIVTASLPNWLDVIEYYTCGVKVS